MDHGVTAAFGAAVLYNLASVVQKSQAERESTTGLRLVVRLFARPVWVLGVIAQIAGLALHLFAMTRAPLTIVQPIIAAGIVFLVAFAALILGERPGGRELVGMATTAGGVALLLSSDAGPVTMAPVTTGGFLAVILTTASVVAALVAISARLRAAAESQAAVTLGVAVGVAQGMSDAMNRLMSAWLVPGVGWRPPAAMATAAIAGVLAFGSLGFALTQDAFRLYRANTLMPSMQTAQLIVPVGIAVALYGQPLPSRPEDAIAWALAFVLVAVGVAALSSSRRIAVA